MNYFLLLLTQSLQTPVALKLLYIPYGIGFQGVGGNHNAPSPNLMHVAYDLGKQHCMYTLELHLYLK